MANRSLGTLTYNLVASIGGFTSGMDQAERQADKSAKAINASLVAIGTAAGNLGTKIGEDLKAGFEYALDIIPKLIDKVGAFQDIADKTGGSAAGFAAFAVSAKTADVSIDEIASASTRLSKALLQAGDDTKPITVGLNAIGVNIAQLKQQSPDQQIATIANALSGFADGANKAAVAQQIFGKSGADLLKFFKDYTDNGGGVSTLTQQMITDADNFTDAQKRAGAQLELFAGSIAVQAIPAITAFKELVITAGKEILGLNDNANSLAGNRAFETFADNVGIQLARVLDYLRTTKKEFSTVTDLVGAYVDSAKQLSFQPVNDFKTQHGLNAFFMSTGATGQTNAKASVFGEDGAEAADSFVAQYKKTLASHRADANRAALNAVNYGPTKDNRPDVPAIPPAKKGAADQAAQDAKAQLNADLDAIKNIGKAQEDAIKNNEKLLDAYHSAGITDDTDYYAQRKKLIDQDTAVQVDSLNQQIARMQQQSFTGKTAIKDQIDNNKKIADAQAQITKIQADAVTQSKVLDIQEQQRLRNVQVGYLAARQAAEDYFDQVNKGYAQNLAAVGKGDKTNDFNASINSITNNFDQQRKNVQNKIDQAKKASPTGTVNDDLQKGFDNELAIIDEFEAKSLASFKQNYADILAAQSDWQNGAIKSLQNYADQAANTADLTKGVFDDAFKGLEDNLVSFFTTGKANWKDFANSIIADITRILVKQQILGPLAQALGGSQASGGTGLLGALGKLLGGGGGDTGDALGAFIDLNGFASGGFTGVGAANDPAGIVHKGEYVLTAAQTKAIGVGNLDAGNFGGGVTIHQSFAAGTSRATTDQAALSAARAITRAQRKYG